MRRTLTGVRWLHSETLVNEKSDAGELVGIALGSDFCSEHEWGIEHLKYRLGCDSGKIGIERRVISALPPDLRYVQGKSKAGKKTVEWAAIFMRRSHSQADPTKLPTELERNYGDNPVVCAWDEDSFGICAYADADKANLKFLWEAFQRKDIAFWANIGPFHIGGGLIFVLPSKLPPKMVKDCLDSDLDQAKLEEADKATGIKTKLSGAKLGFFALTPKWTAGFVGVTTQHPVVYWLNPMDQQRYNAGWFTVEQLIEWIEGKGKVIRFRPG
jgi:hypothetical protein